MKIAVFGAGNVGTRLTQRFRHAGLSVVLCTREGGADTQSFAQGAASADVILLAIPFTAVKEVLHPLANTLAGKLIIDCTNPLNTDWSPLSLGKNNSAAEEIAQLVPNAQVVKAFNTIFADVMTPERQNRDGLRITAFIAGDDAQARQKVAQMAEHAGFAALEVGSLKIARYLEALAHLNIQIAVNQAGGTNAAFIYHQIKA